MLVEVDEPGDTTWRVASITRTPLSGVSDSDLDRPAPDPDVAHGIESRLGIHDASVGDDEIVGGAVHARTPRVTQMMVMARARRLIMGAEGNTLG